ncbi:MAG: hypothetical protein ABIH11_00105 [Candidatus Altiarchaeota archaeon]
MKKKCRGLVFTAAVVLLIIPLILLIAYYSTMEKTKSEDTIGKIRCDELHFFVEDLKEDMRRAMVIFGRRAAIYAIDDVVTTGNTLGEYTFNCSSACKLDCDRFRFNDNGTEAAIAELSICGTLRGENITYMINHTLSQWINRVEEQGSSMRFNLSVDVRDIRVVPYDAWNFASIVNLTLDAYDQANMCYYIGTDITTTSYTSILGLEDVLYPINTDSFVVKYIENCTTTIYDDAVAGCSLSDYGEGVGTGNIIFHSNITDDYAGGLSDYCVNQDPDVINEQVLVLDKGFGGCNQYEEQVCFNASDEHHFAGVINYGPNDPQSFANKCNITIPWISHTCKMDDETKFGPGGGCSRPEGCDEGNISTGTCVTIKNNEECNLHQVLMGVSSEVINTTCYHVSNASLYGGVDGPSFFDRIDGRYNLSERYVNQSQEYFNNTMIGFETLVSPYVLDAHGITPKTNATWIGYLYWQGIEGCRVHSTCLMDDYALMLDGPHAGYFYVDTQCENITNCLTPDPEECGNCVNEDEDFFVDWLDPDCETAFEGCGEVMFCDPEDTGHCSTCDNPLPPLLQGNDTAECPYYGFNTTEWHFYRYSPGMSGLLTLEFMGNAGVGGVFETDMVIYNYSIDGDTCTNRHLINNLEPSTSESMCVLGGGEYMIGVDVDASSCSDSDIGNYTLKTWITEDVACPSASTTTSTATTSTMTSSTDTTSTSSTTTTLCGFYDDFEDTGYSSTMWSHGDVYDSSDDWALGNPSYHNCYSTTNCYGTDITGSLSGAQQYSNRKDEWLMTPELNLTVATNAKATFMLKYDIHHTCAGSWCHDYAIMQVSDDQNTWTTIDSECTSSSYCNPWRDYWWGWHQDEVDLSPYDGQIIWLRFLLHTDNNFRRPGLYIDDFNVSCH